MVINSRDLGFRFLGLHRTLDGSLGFNSDLGFVVWFPIAVDF